MITIQLTEAEARAYVLRASVYERASIYTRVREVIQAAMPPEPIPVEWSEDVGEIGQWIGELREFDSCTARAMILFTDKGYDIACTRNSGTWVQLPSRFIDLETAKLVAEKWLRNS